MANITVTVPDDVYRQARIRAAERGTSVSALVAEYLAGLSADDAEFERLVRLQHEVQAAITSFSAGGRLTREEAHSRAVR
jgi:plasmid stability protein